METVFLNTIELISEWRCWILPPVGVLVLTLTIHEIIRNVTEEIDQ